MPTVKVSKVAVILACICGADLADAKVDGLMTMGGIACHYRTCLDCFSTRAWMAADVVPGRKVCCYLDLETSEIAGEWDSLLDALVIAPSPGAELRRNGRVLASVVESPLGERVWLLAGPAVET